MASLHDFTMKTIDGDDRPLGDFKGKACLVVNVASKCGLTPQYEGLQQLYAGFRERGLEVLGFPCNQFGGQEPGSDSDVKDFSSTRYGVTFPMFSKLEVNGEGRDPLYAWLTGEDAQPEGGGDIKWNFTKFLVDADGRVVARFGPRTAPDDEDLRAAIERTLT